MAIRITCDVQDGDREWTKRFEEALSDLVGLVEESFESKPVVLLSPVLRKMVRDKARQVGAMYQKISGRIVVDNPIGPLSKTTE